ncbi:MAG: hypothetical protein WKG01_11845 [Kofleriaceae bacterium]
MSALDLPPGIGLLGAPLAVFRAPRRASVLATLAIVVTIVLGVASWYFVAQRPWRRGSSVMITLPVAMVALAMLGHAVRRAQLAITRDGVRWGWATIGFHQPASKIVMAHIYRDGITLEARRGSWWFLGARDWDRFDVLVRHLRRAELPIEDHDGAAPFRARLQSYGRFLDGLMIMSILGAIAIALWAA